MYDYKKYAVLYVDDEEKALKYFQKAFQNEFRILTAQSSQEAEGTLRNEEESKIGIVITDQRMPGETGVELLGRVRRTNPNIVRMLTTAYSDLDSAIEAVNSGAIFKYVVKPWDLRELRGCLMRGMEFFLVQEERDTLLREKISMLERLIITDRVRSLAILAAGLGHHLRNPMTALKTFLDLIPKKLKEELSESAAVKNSEFWEDYWSVAERESEHILNIIDNVGKTVIQPFNHFNGPFSLNDLMRMSLDWAREKIASQGGSISVDVAPDLPQFLGNDEMLNRLFNNLLKGMFTLNPFGIHVTLRAKETISVWGTPGVKIVISEDSPAWTENQIESLFTPFSVSIGDLRDPGLDLLSAFFIVHHHGGDILVHQFSPIGPGFEVQLPFDPNTVKRPTLEENYLKKIMTHFETWDTLRGS